jgi:hypothetical protein
MINEKLFDELDKLGDLVGVAGKRLSIVVLNLFKSLIIYSIIVSIYLSIYYSQGLEVTLIIMATGLIYFGMKNKSNQDFKIYEFKKMLKAVENERTNRKRNIQYNN